MSTTWLDKAFNAGTDLLAVSRDLDSLASAMWRLGMTVPADELEDMAKRIRAAQKEIASAISDNISEGVRTAERSTGTMMAALVAGMKIGAEAKP
jgi:predicted ATP-grasp superfamily ATP-dependent carboligase